MDSFNSNSKRNMDDIEEVETLLLGEDREDKAEPSTIPFGLSELQEVPYYKRPLVQFCFVSGVGIFAFWLISAAFSGGSPPTIATQVPSEIEEERVKLLAALDEEREKIRQLELQNALFQQKNLEVTVSKPETKTKPAPKPAPQTVKTPPPVVTNTPPRPVPQRTAAPVRPQPVVVKSEPALLPMEQWLASADRGHYTTALITDKKPTRLVSREFQLTKPSDSSIPPLLEDNQLQSRFDSTNLLDESELTARFNGSHHQKPKLSSKQPTPGAIARNFNQIIDIGSSAEATLESAVVWSTGTRSQQNKKYLLRLKEEFKNIDGKAILPTDTRLIAQVREFDNSGLLFMEVTQILHEGQRINVTPGSLLIEGKKGSPLKADLKQKGDSDFWANAGSILAPGVERTFETVGDTLVIEDGDRSIFRTDNSSRDPLASGAAGIADGVSQALNRRLERNQRETILSYFQLDSGKTVYLKAYEDISF